MKVQASKKEKKERLDKLDTGDCFMQSPNGLIYMVVAEEDDNGPYIAYVCLSGEAAGTVIGIEGNPIVYPKEYELREVV